MIPSASNLNAGSTFATSAVYTSTSGNWSTVTNIFTPTDSSTPASTVSAGDWVSLYLNAASLTPYVVKVLSVAAGVNGGITTDPAFKFGTAPITGSGTVTCKAGGAWLDAGMLTAGSALFSGTVTQPTCINIQVATFASGATARTFGLVGTTTLPVWWRGFKSTIGDMDGNNLAVAGVGNDIPSFTWTSGSCTMAGAHAWFSNIDFLNTGTGNPTVNISAAGGVISFYNCRFTQNNTKGVILCSQANVHLFECILTGNSTVVLFTAAANHTKFDGCLFVGGLGAIAGTTGTPILVKNCIFDSQVGDCITMTTGGMDIIGNTFYGGTGHAISTTGTLAGSVLLDSNYCEGFAAAKFFYTNTTGTNTNLVRAVANTFYNMPGGTYNGMGDSPLIYDNGTLGASGLTAPGSHNFTPTSALRSLGYPGKFETVSAYRSYTEAGAVQEQVTAGGGIGRQPKIRLGGG